MQLTKPIKASDKLSSNDYFIEMINEQCRLVYYDKAKGSYIVIYEQSPLECLNHCTNGSILKAIYHTKLISEGKIKDLYN